MNPERAGAVMVQRCPSKPLLEFLLREERAARLLAEHVDDGHGRCAVCSVGGQTLRMRWPCSIATTAARALALVRERRG